MVQYRSDVEQRRLQVVKANIEDQKRQKIEEARAVKEQKIRAKQNQVRAMAILMPPLPALLLGALVFAVRAGRENRGPTPTAWPERPGPHRVIPKAGGGLPRAKDRGRIPDTTGGRSRGMPDCGAPGDRPSGPCPLSFAPGSPSPGSDLWNSPFPASPDPGPIGIGP
jgi:hypothetical protein